jgi:hypothetical protein
MVPIHGVHSVIHHTTPTPDTIQDSLLCTLCTLRAVPLLCDHREIGKYTRPVSRQRLGKHVPVAWQQILNNAAVGLQQWKSCVFYVVRAERL